MNRSYLMVIGLDFSLVSIQSLQLCKLLKITNIGDLTGKVTERASQVTELVWGKAGPLPG